MCLIGLRGFVGLAILLCIAWRVMRSWRRGFIRWSWFGRAAWKGSGGAWSRGGASGWPGLGGRADRWCSRVDVVPLDRTKWPSKVESSGQSQRRSWSSVGRVTKRLLERFTLVRGLARPLVVQMSVGRGSGGDAWDSEETSLFLELIVRMGSGSVSGEERSGGSLHGELSFRVSGSTY